MIQQRQQRSREFQSCQGTEVEASQARYFFHQRFHPYCFIIFAPSYHRNCHIPWTNYLKVSQVLKIEQNPDILLQLLLHETDILI